MLLQADEKVAVFMGLGLQGKSPREGPLLLSLSLEQRWACFGFEAEPSHVFAKEGIEFLGQSDGPVTFLPGVPRSLSASAFLVTSQSLCLPWTLPLTCYVTMASCLPSLGF